MRIESNASNRPIQTSKLLDLVSDILDKRNKEMKEASNKYDAIQNFVENKGMNIDIRI